MLSIGIVGTYVGKIYSEVKARPRYTIEKTVINEDYGKENKSEKTSL